MSSDLIEMQRDELVERLLAHADAHASVSPCDDEQMQWETDLREAAAELTRLRAQVPEGWREFIEECADTWGVVVVGNRLSQKARQLLSAAPIPQKGVDSG